MVRAPAWAPLLGGATQPQEGLVLSAALNPSVEIAASPRADGKIELVFGTPEQREVFWINELQPDPATPWADGVKAVIDQLHRRKVHFKGFSAAVTGALPSPLKASGPAALAVATALTVRRLYPFSLTDAGLGQPPEPNSNGELPPLSPPERLAFAKLCRAALGESSGLLGPLSCLCGKPWQVMSIDLRFLTVEHLTLVGEGLVFCRPELQPAPLAPPGAEELTTLSQSAAQKLGAKSLRSVESSYLELNRSRLSPEEYAVARHIVAEIQRVVAAERALREEDHRQFGQYLLQSHAAFRELFGDRQELDELLERARLLPSCLGARAEGQTLLGLVPFHSAEGFVKWLGGATGRFESCICHPAGGAG